MTKADQIIAELMDALDKIQREVVEHEWRWRGSYIVGVAKQAMKNCNAQRERNADGYLVVKE